MKLITNQRKFYLNLDGIIKDKKIRQKKSNTFSHDCKNDEISENDENNNA